MIVLLLAMVFMLVGMGKSAICLVFMSMGVAVAMMDMIMIVLESMGMTVLVMVWVAMFFRAMIVIMIMIVVMLVGMDVFMGVFALAHGMPLLLLWLLALQLINTINMHPQASLQECCSQRIRVADNLELEVKKPGWFTNKNFKRGS